MRESPASFDFDPADAPSVPVDQFGEFGELESGEIEAEATRGRALDRELADELEHRAATTRSVSGGYLHELGRRPRMPGRVEQVLVHERSPEIPKLEGRWWRRFCR